MVETDTTNEYETSKVHTLTISKAKKKEGFYVCPVKGVFHIVFPRSSIIAIKETSNSLIIKSKDKSITRYMDDLNDKILTIVKEHSSLWFNTRIDDDLIDEYYISTLQYDKRQGETIRLKVKNLDEIEEAKDFDSSSDVRIVVTLKGLKFFKQKFYPEFQIDLVEVLENETCDPMFNDEDHLDELFVDEDEHPLPSFEEVMTMKEECLRSLKKTCDELAEKLRDIELLYNERFEKLTSLSNCERMNEIIELCEKYRKTQDYE